LGKVGPQGNPRNAWKDLTANVGENLKGLSADFKGVLPFKKKLWGV